MEQISLTQAADAVHGVLKNPAERIIRSIVIDNRQVEEGCLFVAIQGDRFDGHDFIPSALEAGAVAAVSSRELFIDAPYILVEDTRQALLDLGRFCRKQFQGIVVGVTGSVGKTTTKEMIATALSAKFRTLKTQGNLNNEIGLPKTLFGLDSGYQAAVIEMGMSHAGEISRLTKTALPDIGVITNIGVSHLENLGSRENILKAKLEILDGMELKAPLILNGDDDLLRGLSFPGRPVYFCGIENQEADCRAVDIDATGFETRFTILYKEESTAVRLPAIGLHNVMNALFGYLVGRLDGIPGDRIAEALTGYRPAGMRQNTRQVGGMIVIEDCYNASPDSMRAALTTLCQVPCQGRRVAVLGDMLELGEVSRQAHFDVGKLAREFQLDGLFCYGTMAEQIARGAEGIPHLVYDADRQSLTQKLSDYLHPGDAVIFKASRGMRLEEIIHALFGEQ